MKKIENLLPIPSTIEYYLDLWNKSEKYESYREQEKALSLLFEQFPNNRDLSEILLKTSVLNDFYSTSIFKVFPIAKHIMAINDFDCRVNKSDVSLVAEVENLSINGNKKVFRSFASKYCSFHNPNGYYIIDSYVLKMLKKYSAYCKSKKCKDVYQNKFAMVSKCNSYEEYYRIMSRFKRAFNLDNYSKKDIDRFLWVIGRENYPKYKQSH